MSAYPTNVFTVQPQPQQHPVYVVQQQPHDYKGSSSGCCESCLACCVCCQCCVSCCSLFTCWAEICCALCN
ncbi:unnamed protein product [Caenorhabditis sp. 36 PRJEB53466]|nr:unnamed protein product [Caenorhabditis sp. 36 PRJEB53466]